MLRVNKPIRLINGSTVFAGLSNNVYTHNINKCAFVSNDDFENWDYLTPQGSAYALQPTSDTIHLSKGFNVLFAESLVVTYSPTSFINCLNLHVDCIHKSLLLAKEDLKLFDILCVLEFAEQRGYHFHVLIFSTYRLTKANISKIITSLNTPLQGHELDDITLELTISPVITHQTIKSVASYINYIKKNPLALVSNRYDLCRMFLGFDREHIFSADSVPKRLKTTDNLSKINSNDPLVLFFYHMFEQNKIQYQEILRSPSIQSYLHRPNIKGIYENCKMQYLAQADHAFNLQFIIKNYLKEQTVEPNTCWCPLKEWLHEHDICDITFGYALIEWLLFSSKKNTFLFGGAANSGKSHIARLIWKCFVNPQRIVQDGIFTFSNLVNAGCGLWEEPFITPDNVDTAKLILEGCPDVQIAIKGQSSVKLNKRVPIIITTNHKLERYVSGDRDALNARCFAFDTFKQEYNVNFCNAINHYCNRIKLDKFSDTSNSECSSNAWDSNKEYPCRRSTEPDKETEDCTGYHPVDQKHILAYIAYFIKLSNFQKFGKEISELVFSYSIDDFCPLCRDDTLWLEARHST